MSRQEKLASWQQLKADKRLNAIVEYIVEIPQVQPVQPEVVLPEVELQSIDVDSKPLAQKFGRVGECS
jgi:hypothetical protein